MGPDEAHAIRLERERDVPARHGRISGTVNGAKFKGRWNEAPTRKGPGDAGAVEFTMSADGKKLTGRWNYDGSPTSWHTDWTGTCTNGTCSQERRAAPAAWPDRARSSRRCTARTGPTARASFAASRAPSSSSARPPAARIRPGARTSTPTTAPSARRRSTPARSSTRTAASSRSSLFPGQASYTGSTRNGITSIDWTAYPGSFKIVSAIKGSGVPGVKMGGAGWTASATSFRGQNGGRYRYICPGNAGLGGAYGTNIYTDDSSPCAAAVQLGLFTRTTGGRVTIQIAPRQASYQGTTANGISSQPSTARAREASRSRARRRCRPARRRGRRRRRDDDDHDDARRWSRGARDRHGDRDGDRERPAVHDGDGPVRRDGRRHERPPSAHDRLGQAHRVRRRACSANFKLVRGTDKKKPIVELQAREGRLQRLPEEASERCRRGDREDRPRSSGARARAASARRGRYASATVRGTIWLTADRCDGTFIRVRQGVIEVNDVPKRRVVTVRAPRTYLATP